MEAEKHALLILHGFHMGAFRMEPVAAVPGLEQIVLKLPCGGATVIDVRLSWIMADITMTLGTRSAPRPRTKQLA